MDKIILVIYVKVGNLPSHDVEHYLQNIQEKLVHKNDDILNYIIPIRDGETRIECLNPKLVSKKDYSQAKELLDKNQEIVNEIIKHEALRKLDGERLSKTLKQAEVKPQTKIWIHQDNKKAWYKYFRPIWLNSITWKKGEKKVYRWLFWGYTTN